MGDHLAVPDQRTDKRGSQLRYVPLFYLVERQYHPHRALGSNVLRAVAHINTICFTWLLAEDLFLSHVGLIMGVGEPQASPANCTLQPTTSAQLQMQSNFDMGKKKVSKI